LFQHLTEIEGDGNSDLTRALKTYPRRAGKGIGILLSDLLFPSGYDEGLKRLLHLDLELHVFHVMSPAELRPDLDGDILLLDAETGDEVPLTVTDEVLQRYERTVRAYAEGIEQNCKRLGIGYSLLLADVDVESFVMGALRRQGMLL
jgi:hypothetical protein